MATVTHRIGPVEISFDASDLRRAAKRFHRRQVPTTERFAIEAAQHLADLVRKGNGPAKSDRDTGTFKVLGVRVRYRAVEQQP